MVQTLVGKRILLVIAGGIAAYKSLELIRRLRERGAVVRAILTKSGAEFVTPLSVSALTGEKVYCDLFDLTDEAEMGHIQLSRAADLVVVAPATADLLAASRHPGEPCDTEGARPALCRPKRGRYGLWRVWPWPDGRARRNRSGH